MRYRRSRWVAPPRASPLEREPLRHLSGRLSCLSAWCECCPCITSAITKELKSKIRRSLESFWSGLIGNLL